jgi:ribonuclease Z
MDVLFLGTASGAPTKKRNVSAIALLESKGKGWFLIDCGEGTQQQLLHTKLSLNRLRAVLITHTHGDHCYGLPGLLSSVALQGRTAPLTVIAPRAIAAWFASTMEYTSMYLPYEVTFVAVEELSELAMGRVTITSVVLSHRVASYAYQFREITTHITLDQEKLHAFAIPQGPVWGQLQSGQCIHHQGQVLQGREFIQQHTHSQSIIICGDNDTPALLADYVADCDVLVHEATYADEQVDLAATYGHSYAGLVARFAADVAIPNLVLTHISTRYASGVSVLNDASRVYSGTLYLAADFDRFHLGTNGILLKV